MNTPMLKIRVLGVILGCLVLLLSQAIWLVQAMPLAQTPVSCTSKSGTEFYMRKGPGPQYTNVGRIDGDVVVNAIARDTSGKWVHIKMVDVDTDGWSAAAVLQCDSSISKLPVDTTVKNPDNQNGKKVTIRKSRSPDGGVNHPDFVAELYTVPFDVKTFGQLQNIPVFRDALSFRVKVYDRMQGTNDGDGIQYVEFNFRAYTLDEDGNPVQADTPPTHDYPPDDTPSFCAFAGDDPSCNPALVPDDSWPDGIYEMTVQMQGTADDAEGGKKFSNWNQYFFAIQRSATNARSQTDLVVRLAQTGPENTDTLVADELVFQVEAYDPKVGNEDGDGITSVDLEIFGPNGRRVYRNTEKMPHYCAFQGGEPDCTIWRFSDHNFRWPNNGPRLQQGQTYTLHAVVHAKNGRKKQAQWSIEFQ
ncbi:MAG: SH3 domain-containing protein [Chloroflexi bacterium]|nr:SH3 domain-containing protein [Chloroflexota bacterium]